MRSVTMISTLVVGLLMAGMGCKSSGNTRKVIEPVGQAGSPVHYTADSNPTTRAGRGGPSLDDHDRPAVWILIDGREGRFVDRDDDPQLQWVIEDRVSATPTFRVEVYEPLLGSPASSNFSAVLRALHAPGVSDAYYGIVANKHTFRTGRDYSLTRPGPDFSLQNRATGDRVSELAPLSPGTYVIAAKIANRKTGREGLAVTHFTVGQDE